MPEAPVAAQMRWWGWGEQPQGRVLPEHALGLLREQLGITERPRPPVALDAVHLDGSELGASTRSELERIVGAGNVREDRRERVVHAAGKGYADLVRMRAGEPEGAPDAVVHPGDHDQVQAVLRVCAAASVAVVPFGGGTSVVGGVTPLRGGHSAVLALDLARLRSVLALDRESATVSVGAGIRGPALERHLGALGLTLGHFPQSFEYVSLGGCAATRSAGQASTGYGAIEKMVLGMRLAAPAGDIELPPLPASAAGPSMRQLLIGSEGTLGVISELSLRVRRAPAERIYEGVFFESFAAGSAVLRELAGSRVLPDLARLSDEQETRMSLALSGSRGVRGRLGEAYLKLRGYSRGCVAIFGFEGEHAEIALRRRRALELARRGGGLPVGRSPGAPWLEGRFAAPYLRDELLGAGVMVETLETAAQWVNLARLHREVSAAIGETLRRLATPGLVMCHISHVYESGASLYFTFLARQREGAEIEQWELVKRAATEAIVRCSGTITHHHAVGRDHVPWMEAEIGELSLDALRAVKGHLDPSGIMNPGKLLSVTR